jgi:Ca2+/H+ antiporter, TMEM165/GDT1 family
VEAFLVSTAVGALAEIGDKTQLLVIGLAANFRKPVPIILGMLVALLLNHTAAGALGAWLAAMLNPRALLWILCLSFAALAIWAPKPVADESKPQPYATPRIGLFATTLWTYFLLEMGDKTQVATIALAAKYTSLVAVVSGTTLGILLVDVPVVILSAAAAQRLPRLPVHRVFRATFVVLSAITLIEALR